MTNQLLQSDIDLAKRLIQERHPDEDILLVLKRRRIDPQKATQLVSALKAGIQVEPELQINYEIGEGLPADQPDTLVPARTQFHENGAPHRRKRSGSPRSWKLWVILIMAVLLAGAILYVFLGRSGSGKENQGVIETAPVDTVAPAEAAPSPAPGSGGAPSAANPAAGEPTPSPQ